MCSSFHKCSYNSERRGSDNNTTKYLANPKKCLKNHHRMWAATVCVKDRSTLKRKSKVQSGF